MMDPIDPAPSSDFELTTLLMVYNQSNYLRASFESVVSQENFNSTKLLISDDASSDGSYELALSLAQDKPNVVVRRNQQNLGVMEHYRHAVTSCDTPYIAVLEADDIWTDQTKLSQQLKFFRTVPQVDCVFSGYSVIRDDDPNSVTRPNIFQNSRSGLVHFQELLCGNPIASFTNCMYRTAVLRDVLSRDVISSGYDWLVNLMIADTGPIGYLGGNFATYRVHTGGTWSRLGDGAKVAKEIQTLKALLPIVSSTNRQILLARIESLST
ncbi:glycosyltransferase [Agrobacterium salinitolerans]|uniref:glycosyltransferase n=1 Tax=Agrobacterium salinitolerans TaxID=1183413 RepID=UPI001571C6A6|nr:glycosyltransferase [Agrobacterium salinitolerans]NTA39812.1 glycosyltransferase [Agrobacterium salinitolerans]